MDNQRDSDLKDTIHENYVFRLGCHEGIHCFSFA